MDYKSNIWKLNLFITLRSMHFFSAVIIPFFLGWGELSFSQLMFLQFVFVFSVFLLEIPTGSVADYFGRKISLSFSALALISSVFLYSITPNFFLFLIGEFLWALGFSLWSGAEDAILYDSLKVLKREKESKKLIGRIHSFEMLGLVIASLIGSLIAYFISVRHTMLLAIIPFGIAFLVSLSIKEPKRKRKKGRYFDTLISGIKYLGQNKVLRILAFDQLSVGILMFMVVWVYQVLLQNQNIPILYFGFVAAAITAVQIPFLNNFELLENIFGSKKNYLSWSAIISGICFILLGFNDSGIITILLVIIIAGFGLSRYTLHINYQNKHIKSINRATVMSTISMIYRFFMGLFYLLFGFMVGWSLTYSLMIIGFCAILFALISRIEEEHLID